MILRIDRWQTELPPPADPDPQGASVVQELMGGKFGEMSTLMNYTFQSFNFRGRSEYRPFYDLIANIAEPKSAIGIHCIKRRIHGNGGSATPIGNKP